MTRNVGKTTAFHGLEPIEAFRPQGCEQGCDLDRNGQCRPTSQLNHFALEMALHGLSAPRAETAASIAVVALTR